MRGGGTSKVDVHVPPNVIVDKTARGSVLLREGRLRFVVCALS